MQQEIEMTAEIVDIALMFAKAFAVGGAICLVAQILINLSLIHI